MTCNRDNRGDVLAQVETAARQAMKDDQVRSMKALDAAYGEIKSLRGAVETAIEALDHSAYVIADLENTLSDYRGDDGFARSTAENLRKVLPQGKQEVE